MTTILIILTGIIAGAINVAFFGLGYYVRGKAPNNETITIDKNNQKSVMDLVNWLNFSGPKE